jgi:hypothetical protein
MTEPNPRIDAGRAVVGKVVAEEVSKGNKRIRELVEPLMEPGEKMKATLPGGMPVGNVQRTETARSVQVNMPELLAWVERNRPDQIQCIVADAYVSHLVTLCKKHGSAFDEATGEVIPGVELREGTSSFRITPSPEGRAYILQKLRELTDIGILDLPSGAIDEDP